MIHRQKNALPTKNTFIDTYYKIGRGNLTFFAIIKLPGGFLSYMQEQSLYYDSIIYIPALCNMSIMIGLLHWTCLEKQKLVLASTFEHSRIMPKKKIIACQNKLSMILFLTLKWNQNFMLLEQMTFQSRESNGSREYLDVCIIYFIWNRWAFGCTRSTPAPYNTLRVNSWHYCWNYEGQFHGDSINIV